MSQLLLIPYDVMSQLLLIFYSSRCPKIILYSSRFLRLSIFELHSSAGYLQDFFREKIRIILISHLEFSSKPYLPECCIFGFSFESV